MDNVPGIQRYVNDRSGLGYSKFEKPSQIKKTVFVESNNAYNNVQTRKAQNNFQ